MLPSLAVVGAAAEREMQLTVLLLLLLLLLLTWLQAVGSVLPASTWFSVS